ncbi:MAG: ABC-F family ATP-binding cassette domain-containing protein [Ruminiclostridium sp.]|nr:ABC-F family ATP-binding cassette domain-containing protein [Ruminiclostridium sp.]
MIVLSGNNITVEFGGEVLFSDACFRLENDGRAGLVGVNGCGKTTLFKVINGECEAAEGNINKTAGVKIGYMEQYIIRNENMTLYEEVLEIFRPLIDMEQELYEIGVAIDSGDHSEKTLQRQMHLNEKFQQEGGLVYKSKTTSALLGLGFDKEMLSRPISVLSGGQKSKAQLAKLLLSDSNVLLLDEPTNHLDIKACEWLEKFLFEYKGAYIVISHDRYFLDKVTNITYEMENGRLHEYKGNYSRFLELKAEARLAQQRQYDKTMKEIHRIEGIIEQQRSWKVEHNYITAFSKQKQVDRLKETLDKPEDAPEELRFRLRCKEGGGNDVLMAEKLCKSFDGEKLFSSVDLDIKKNERVFILGENGCGKTTLLKILTGQLPADFGTYRYGSEIEWGYYDQSQSSLTPTKTVLDELWDDFPRMTQTEVRTALGSFMFHGDDVFKLIGNLSGGEKARISLLKLMLRGGNLLFLDEPTNHLDIHSREALEKALSEYGGTLVVVSHDRYLINKLASRIILLKPDGIVKVNGNYDTYVALTEAEEEKPVVKQEEKKPNDYKLRKERESNIRKLKTALSRTEKEIEETEQRIEEATELLSSPEYSSDYEKAMKLSLEIEELKQKEEELTARWMEISEELESAE